MSKMIFFARVFVLCLLLVSSSIISCAHQPRTLFYGKSSESDPFFVEDPEVSKAYYGELNGSMAYFEVMSEKPFSLYVNVLVAERPGKPLVSAEVLDSSKNRILLLDQDSMNWTHFYEPYGRDDYLMGPEERLNVSAGVYYIRVFNQENKGKYVLAIGESEDFPPLEIAKTVILMPVMKIWFFGSSNAALAVLISALIVLLVLVKLAKRLKK